MPTYEYKCSRCGHQFEVFQRISEDPIEKCEKCGGRVKRLIGAGAGIIFKGNGFYATDYRSEDYKVSEKADRPSTETPETKEDKSKTTSSDSESKPAKSESS